MNACWLILFKKNSFFKKTLKNYVNKLVKPFCKKSIFNKLRVKLIKECFFYELSFDKAK